MMPFNNMFSEKEIKKGSRNHWSVFLWIFSAVAGLGLLLYVSYGIGYLRATRIHYKEGIKYGYALCKQHHQKMRGVAQPGSAPALGAGSRRFKSSLPDQSDPCEQCLEVINGQDNNR